MFKRILIGFSLVILLLLLLILKPVPIISESEALVEKGEVISIVQGTEMDVLLKLKGNSRTYYINRGLERGLTMAELSEKLLGNNVTFKYPKYWTPLDWNQKIKHLSKIETNDEVIFTELKDES